MKRVEGVEYEAYEILTQGYDAKDVLRFQPARTSCGKIKDGVALEHNKEGGWIISYKDLIEMARLATEARKKK
jgi:hypothetical protein